MTVTIDATGPPWRVRSGWRPVIFTNRARFGALFALGRRAMIGTIRFAFAASPGPGDGQ